MSKKYLAWRDEVVKPRIAVTLPMSDDWAVTATCGTAEIVTTGTGTLVNVDVSSYGTWNISAESDNYEAIAQNITITKSQVYSLHLGLGGVYGVEWDKTSNPQMSRTDEALLFSDPVPYVLGASSYGSPFDNIYPWSGMEVVEDEDCGTMVKIPKFYFKLENDTTFRLQITDSPTQGFSTSPAPADRGDGSGEREYVYVSRYHCSEADYKSRTGAIPKASITRATARTNIHALGSDVWQYDYAMLVTIWMLYLVEFANWNSQTKIGYGCGNGSAKEAVGASDTMPYHTGTMQSSRTTYGVGVQYRHIEGLWDNCYDWCDGIYYSGTSVYAIKTPSNFSDATNGTLIGTRPDANGYPTDVFVPTAAGFEGYMHTCGTGGGSTTYICDYLYVGGVVLCVGGYYYQGASHGLFYLGGGYSTGGAGTYVGCRLQKLP